MKAEYNITVISHSTLNTQAHNWVTQLNHFIAHQPVTDWNPVKNLKHYFVNWTELVQSINLVKASAK